MTADNNQYPYQQPGAEQTRPLSPHPINQPSSPQTRLVLPGQQPADMTMHSDHTSTLPPPTLPSAPPIHSRQTAPLPPVSTRPRSRVVGWLAVCSIIAVIVIVLVAFLSGMFSPTHQTPVGQKTLQQPTSAPATIPPTVAPTPTLPSSSKVFNGIVITPALFHVQSDCQPDNGYRCTATLSAPTTTVGSIPWWSSVSTDGDQVNPRKGTLAAGEQVQLIIYIHQQCPYNGILDIEVQSLHTDVPMNC